jgi:sec-independent protein translocase protein TatA
MFGLRAPELLLIFAVLLLLFGATKLPALGSSLGAAIRNFKKGFGSEGEDGLPGDDKKSQAASLSSASRVESPGSTTAQRKDA